MSRSTGLHAIFRKIAILFGLSKDYPIDSLFCLAYGILLISYILSNSFQREPAFQFLNQFNVSTAIDIIEGTVVEKSH